MTLFEQYKKSKLDLSSLDFGRGPARSDYFCTPVGARVIGWAGVDGIHFCFIKDFGEMVFAVSPMNEPGNYVHPVARNFQDFMRLLAACGGTAALEQVHGWKRSVFEEFINEEVKMADAQIAAFWEEFSVTPMEDPYTYIRELQSSFDYRRLRFREDYYEWVPAEPIVPTAPEWKVYYGAGFFEHHGHGRAGKEIPLEFSTAWGDEIWHIPAMYSCGKGLVMDMCVSVDPLRIQAYIDKWDLLRDDGESLRPEERRQAMWEDPLDQHFACDIVLNGQLIHANSRSGMRWIPNVPEEMNGLESKWLVEHYNLDMQRGWSFHRVHFPWPAVRKPKIQSLKLCLKQNRVSMPAGQFTTRMDARAGAAIKAGGDTSARAGSEIQVHHPVIGEKYTLVIDEISQETLEINRLPQKMEYPARYTQMIYHWKGPEEPHVLIQDYAQGDTPRLRKLERTQSESMGGADGPMDGEDSTSNAAAIGIIGGADGPTAMFIGGFTKEPQKKIACSSMHFEACEEVTWEVVFQVKTREDMEVTLL